MAALLPLDIISEILYRLPLKSLTRFKCVSKPWNSLITSPNFIKHHLTQTLISNPNPNIAVSHYSVVTATITAGTDSNIRFSAVDHPLQHLPHRLAVELIDSCNGVLLISDNRKGNMHLFNPSTKTHRFVPPAPSNAPNPNSYAGAVEVFGFGYDCCSDDYKVVRLLQWIGPISVGLCGEIFVYSLRKNSWTLIKDETTLWHLLQQTNAVSAKEMLHFIVVDRKYKPKLKCFDLRTETFSILDCPEMENDDSSKMTMSLRNLNGCLCLLVNHQRYRVDPREAVGDPLYNRCFLSAEVWEMRERGKKESWVKLFRIRKSEIVENCMYLRLITYSKDKGSVLVEVDGIWFGWYDLVAKKMEKVSVQGLRDEEAPHMAFTFVESLVSVADDKVVTKGGTMTKKGIKKYRNDFLSSGFKLRL
ncbi:hypothetical protein RND81_07G154400 [Saponaria officinalis]|uniref:F-box domain-containing protein n=1 Tax=Saponaria officinalis TaxID=3572 RepID=A0AAW1JU82_SAPOF